ncbi:unnamed protein product [Leptidea sinapis]|uniref:Uncharacterized protein n=1 Tax=Leptidea sinapis TaxID=189913 RepID=A0A5E4Q3K2_9NEOP|nr:unnamed protein product [Leptidea sinapis]
MQSPSWRSDSDWKTRYKKLYSSRGLCRAKDVPMRISFMSNEQSPYASLLMKLRASSQSSTESDLSSPPCFMSLMSYKSGCTYRSMSRSDNLGENDTLLLDMVRSRSRNTSQIQDEMTAKVTGEKSEERTDDICMHGLSLPYRGTERSVSRSRVSRMSTRRDMDIPSILAFTASVSEPTPLEIPAFKKATSPDKEEIPKWSIRRSVCPVCSQKWRDRSTVKKIKYSGLKRNPSMDLPSIIAPARVRTAVDTAFSPRPVPLAFDEKGFSNRSFRNRSNSWLLTRARRFRAPKSVNPPPEATAPPSSIAPLARKDLDLRVSRFLSDEFRSFSENI